MKRSNSTFFGSVAVLIVIVSIIYCWKMLIPEYQKNKTDLTQTNEEYDSAKAKLDSLKTAKNDLEQLGDIVDQMFIAIPEDTDTPNLITELEAIAIKNKTAISNIQISDSGTSATAGTTSDPNTSAVNQNAISVAFSVEGGFDTLNQFIASLEKDVRFMNVKSLVISKLEDKMSLAIQLEVYRGSNTSLSSQATAGQQSTSTSAESQSP